MNIGVILSGGTGSRFGANLPKQYLPLCGKKVIEYSIQALEECEELDIYLVMAAEEYCMNPPFSVSEKGKVIPGGDSRNASLKAALSYIEENYPKCEKVFIHEAARPFLRRDIITEYLQKLDEFDAVITTKKITDSLGSIKEWYVNREEYYLIQAPEAFRFSLLNRYFKADSPITATSQQLPEESKVYQNFAFTDNLKITYPEDFLVAEHMMNARGW